VPGTLPALGGRHSSTEYPDATESPGIVLRCEAPLCFASSGQFRDQIRELVHDRTPEWIVRECEAVTDSDITAAEALQTLDEERNDRGTHLAVVELRDRLQDRV
jgi:MFS superfamily sulfate permease-like transporter